MADGGPLDLRALGMMIEMIKSIEHMHGCSSAHACLWDPSRLYRTLFFQLGDLDTISGNVFIS
jgi:hypothetical protein